MSSKQYQLSNKLKSVAAINLKKSVNQINRSFFCIRTTILNYFWLGCCRCGDSDGCVFNFMFELQFICLQSKLGGQPTFEMCKPAFKTIFLTVKMQLEERSIRIGVTNAGSWTHVQSNIVTTHHLKQENRRITFVNCILVTYEFFLGKFLWKRKSEQIPICILCKWLFYAHSAQVVN